MQPALWITWERHRRTRTLSRRFEAELVEIVVGGARLARYAASIAQTLRVIHKRRPRLLFLQSPSIVLALVATTIGRIWSARVVVDAHNAAIFPFEGRFPVLNWACRKSLQMADFVLVSNEELREMLGLDNVLVLADPLPDGLASKIHDTGDAARLDTHGGPAFRVTYVASWAADEPFMEVIEAARLLPEGIQVRVTGRPPTGISHAATLPDALILLGYLDDSAYVAELHSADVVLVLTTRQACLTCGAYEALSLEKPLILSATPALRAYFRDAAIYTENTSAAIFQSILVSQSRCAEMQVTAAAAKHAMAERWQEKFNEIKHMLFAND